jgi:hypothetical protein
MVKYDLILVYIINHTYISAASAIFISVLYNNTDIVQTAKLMLERLAQVLEIRTVTSTGFTDAVWLFIYILAVLLC